MPEQFEVKRVLLRGYCAQCLLAEQYRVGVTQPPHLRPPMIRSDDYLKFYARRARRRAQRVMCLQVGANDGKTTDPVHAYFRDWGWHGVLVEPQPDVFEHGLTPTYSGNPRIALANVALGTTEGDQPFYRIAFSRDRWATGLSSFRREHLQAHIDSGYVASRAAIEGVPMPSALDEIIEETVVPTISLAELLDRHGLDKVDVFCIDAEGYDAEIIEMIDFARCQPDVVMFESQNLPADTYEQLILRFQNLGFFVYWSFGDTVAVRIPYPTTARIRAALQHGPLRGLRKLRRLGVLPAGRPADVFVQ